jgi:hypothetical protein
MSLTNSRKDTVQAKYFIFIMLLYGLQGCYEPQEGCMDVYASNFEVSADRDCCCTYPQLRILNDFVLDTSDFSQSSFLYDVNNTAFLVRNVALGMYDIQISGERNFTAVDSLNIFRDPSVFSKILMISTRNIVQPFRTIKEQIVFNSQSLQLGFPEEIDDIPSDSIPGNYILGNYRYLYDTTDMIWRDGSVTIVPDTSQIDSTIRLFFNNTDLRIDGNVNGMNEIGGNADLILQIDLAELFNDFSLESSLSEQESSVTNSLSDALMFIEE